MSEQLKTCPFCGEKPRIKADYNSIGEPFFQVRHDCKCLLSMIKTFYYKTEFEAVTAWNNRAEQKNEPLTLNELKQMDIFGWVWIEVIEPYNTLDKVSAYYRKCDGYDKDITFCCGYPGYIFGFKYSDYGKTWLAYRHKKED